jgi:PPOX class probable F420-dependent enzyme
MTPDEARSRFAAARVARLATVGVHGQPHVVPITFVVDGDRIVTAVDAKPKRPERLRRIENIAAHPLVALLVDHYDEDWRRLWWVRADGRARVVDDGPEANRAFELLRDRYPQYASVELTGPAIVVSVERWVGWSAEDGIGLAGLTAP